MEQARQREGVIIDAFLNGNTASGKLGWNQVLDQVQVEMAKLGVEYSFPQVSRDIATEQYSPEDFSMDEGAQDAFMEALRNVANSEIQRYNKAEGKNRKLLKDITPAAVADCFKGTLPANLKIFKVLFNEPGSRFRMDADLLYSSQTTLNLAAAHNGLYSLFNSQGGVSGYKSKQGTTVYWGDILKKNWDPEVLRKEGGVRYQSNSDSQMYTLLDQVQMFMDFTAKGYYLQAYTKVLSQLKLLGLSRGKMNASLIPKVVEIRNADGSVDVEKTRENAGLDEKGNPIYDDIEGINHAEAFMLISDPEYSKSVGGVCIGYSDNHIRKLLDVPQVQLIIGFHDKTNDPSKRYPGARYAKNYNGINEAVKKDGKTVHIGFNKYVKKAEGKFHYDSDTETFEGTIDYKGKVYHADDIPMLAADLYLEDCAKKGYTPAYNIEGVVDHPNYYKTLADFALKDSQGHYASHRKVAYNMPDTVPYLDAGGNKQTMKTEDYIRNELEKELRVRDDIAEALADDSSEGIIPQFVERVREQQARSYKNPTTKPEDSWESEKYQFNEDIVVGSVYDIRHNQAERGHDLVKIGTMPYLYRALFDLTGDVFVSNSHLYANIVSKNDAINENRYIEGDGTDYHDLGEAKMISAIMQFQNPMVIMESLKDFETPRLVAVLDEKGHKNNLIAVLELYANRRAYGESHERNHVLITIYEKDSLPDYIDKTLKKGRILYIKNGVAADTLADLQLVGDISATTLKNNISEFLKKVNKFKADKKIDYKLPVGGSVTAGQVQAAKEKVAGYRDALKEAKGDTRIMEQEFMRIARAFEVQARRSGKKDVQISDLKQALNAEAKKHWQDVNIWEKEFDRLLKAYDAAGRKIANLEADIEHRKQAAKEKVDGRKSTEIRNKIKKLKADLQQQALGKSGERYIPRGLMNAIVDVCDAIDDSSDLYKADGSLNKGQAERNAVAERLRDLQDAYHDLKTDDDTAIASEYEVEIEEYLGQLRKEFSGKNLSELSRAELEKMYDILKSISQAVIDARKLIGWNENEDVYGAGYAIIGQQNAINEGRKHGKRSWAQKVRDKDTFMTVSPVRNVEMMSDWDQKSALVRLFADFEAGVRKKNLFTMRAYKVFEALSTGKAYENAVYKPFGDRLTDDNGKVFRASKMQMMQAILSYERELANNTLSHIRTGGLVFADIDKVAKGKLADAISKENAHRISNAAEVVERFQEALENDKWAQEYMDAARKFFNETAKDAINETTMLLKHRLVATDKAYIPYEVDKNFVVREVTAMDQLQQTISGYGMLKDVQRDAKQPLIMTGLNNMIERHIDQVGNVYGLAVPVRNFNKVWNVKNQDVSVKDAIDSTWGKEGLKMIEQTVMDLQGSRPGGNTAIEWVRGKYISSQFALNLSVVLKQVGSLYSAVTELDGFRDPVRMWGNLIRTMAQSKKIAAEVDQYTASAWIRRQGLSDAELATLANQSKRNGLSRWWNKAPTVLHPTKWITGMDHAVALSLWTYCKKDTAKRTGLTGEALLQETAKMYDRVIEKTQSMNDVLHRPEIQRSKNLASELFGMFKTDLFQMVGQISEKYHRMRKDNTAENRAAFVKTLYAITANIGWGVFITALMSLVRYKPNAYKDEETGEITMESILRAMAWDAGGELLGYVFPMFGGDIYSVVENVRDEKNYDVLSSLGIDALNTGISALKEIIVPLREGQIPTMEEWEKLAISLGQFSGVPANSIVRGIKAIQNHAKDFANGKPFSFEAGSERSTKQYMNSVISAYGEDADEAKALFDTTLHSLAVRKAGENYTEDDAKEVMSSLQSQLGNAYKEGKVSAEDAEGMLADLFGKDEDEVYWILDKWDYAIETGSSENYGKYNDLFAAIDSGKDLKAVVKAYTDNGVTGQTLCGRIADHYKEAYIGMSTSEKAKAKGYIINGYVACGKTRDETLEILGDWEFEGNYGFAYSDRKRAFINGEVSESQLRSIMASRGVAAKEIDTQVSGYKFAKAYPQYEISDAKARDWYELVQPTGLLVADYVRFVEGLRACTGTDRNGDGKADKNSVKKQKIELINSFDLTPKQKRVLREIAGIS